MTTGERYSTEVKLRNTEGREFVVKHYVNPEGYLWKGQRLMCTTCDVQPATQRLEVYTHLYETHHSEYYCDACVPPSMTRTGE